MDKKEIVEILASEDKNFIHDIFKSAYEVKTAKVGTKVYYRGIIEFSNICTKNCSYCGIRKSSTIARRYEMTDEEILNSAMFAYRNGYGSIVLQSGERSDDEFVGRVEKLLKRIKRITENNLGITLSLGEQTRETYSRWFRAGAHRYLLRIETSNPFLYGDIHPKDHSFERRISCLEDLKKTGYQVGTGVMIGIPGQKAEDLADDIMFFKTIDVDMLGMGPYLPSKGSPFEQRCEFIPERNYILALKMIAAARLYLEDINIASTTALQALSPEGREQGLKAGANVIMPNITPVEYRDSYLLYDNKPRADENKEDCLKCLEKRIELVGEDVGYNEWGDSPHFFKRLCGKRILESSAQTPVQNSQNNMV